MLTELTDFHIESRASNLSYRMECLAKDAIESGFNADDLRSWFDEALEIIEDES